MSQGILITFVLGNVNNPLAKGTGQILSDVPIPICTNIIFPKILRILIAFHCRSRNNNMYLTLMCVI